jgi:glycosyltransferase involved in cell wall biosynthesis
MSDRDAFEHRPAVLVYADRLLPASETFIVNQSEAMERFTPYYVGSRRVRGLPLPEPRTMVANGSGLPGRIRQAARLALTGTTGTARLAKRLARLEPAFIQAHYGPGGANAMPLRRALEVPLFVYFHGIDATMTEAFARRRLYYRLYWRRRDQLRDEADLLITTSQFIRSRLLDQGFPAEKTVVHYIGVPPKTPAAGPPEERGPLVLFVARLVEKKGGRHLIDAMALVERKVPEAELVIVGDGPLRSRLEAQAKAQLKRCRFTGWQTPEEVAGWMQRARVFCVPSVTARSGDAEGLGMVFLEAQSHRVPVVSFVHGGIPEAVAHGETGLLAPEGDVPALADHLLALLTDDALWRRFSVQGPPHVDRRFNLRTQTRKLEQIYLRHLGCGYAGASGGTAKALA